MTVVFGRGGQSIQKVDRFLFVLLAQVGIPHGHVHSRMAQDLLEFLHGAPSHNEMACEGVPRSLNLKFSIPALLSAPLNALSIRWMVLEL